MGLAGRLLVLRAGRATARAARDRRRTLQAQVRDYCSPAQRLDLLATLDRYPDAATQELREILNRPVADPWERWYPGRR